MVVDVVLTDTRDVLAVLGDVFREADVRTTHIGAALARAGQATIAVGVTPCRVGLFEQAAAALGVHEPHRIVSSERDGAVQETWTLRLPDTVVTLTGIVLGGGE